MGRMTGASSRMASLIGRTILIMQLSSVNKAEYSSGLSLTL
jgi:hypothetical protein